MNTTYRQPPSLEGFSLLQPPPPKPTSKRLPQGGKQSLDKAIVLPIARCLTIWNGKIQRRSKGALGIYFKPDDPETTRGQLLRVAPEDQGDRPEAI